MKEKSKKYQKDDEFSETENEYEEKDKVKQSKDKKETAVLAIGLEERDLFVDRFNSLYRPKPKKTTVAKEIGRAHV